MSLAEPDRRLFFWHSIRNHGIIKENFQEGGSHPLQNLAMRYSHLAGQG